MEDATRKKQEHRRRNSFRALLSVFHIIAFMGIFSFGGCGPISSGTLILDAQKALLRAEAEGAKNYALYELLSAEQCLYKAREEMSYSNYRQSVKFAEQALHFANQARDRARDVKQTTLESAIP